MTARPIVFAVGPRLSCDIFFFNFFPLFEFIRFSHIWPPDFENLCPPPRELFFFFQRTWMFWYYTGESKKLMLDGWYALPLSWRKWTRFGNAEPVFYFSSFLTLSCSIRIGSGYQWFSEFFFTPLYCAIGKNPTKCIYATNIYFIYRNVYEWQWCNIDIDKLLHFLPVFKKFFLIWHESLFKMSGFYIIHKLILFYYITKFSVPFSKIYFLILFFQKKKTFFN